MRIISSFEVGQETEDRLKGQFPEVNFSFYKNIKEAEEALVSTEVILTYGSDITEEIIDKATALKWIMVLSAGLEQLPIKKLIERNILVTNVRGIHAIPMAEFAFGYMLQHAKKLAAFAKQQEQKNWKRLVPLKELYGQTLLVVGAGAIGSQIAKYANVFGMNTIGINTSGRNVAEFEEVFPISELNHVLPKADYVVSVLPSTERTKNVYNLKQFQMMKEDAVFINMGRGDAVNEADLLKALSTGEIAHAYLDVFNEEPLPEAHPFWNHENITITPHLSAVTDLYLPRGMEIFEENLRTYIKGGNEYINRIEMERGY